MTPYCEADGITIYHGDCREYAFPAEVDVCVTSPPYLHQRGYAEVSDSDIVDVFADIPANAGLCAIRRGY